MNDSDLEYVLDTNPARTVELTILEYLENVDPILAQKVRQALS